jgi:uncharacterized delta-60 repeat protein
MMKTEVISVALAGLCGVSLFGQGVVDGFASNVASRVDVVTVQPDGKILIAGLFGGPARLNVDGTFDTNFAAQITGGSGSLTGVRAMTVQEDGKIIVGGFFRTPAPFIRTNLARLWPDGSLDTNFVADADNTVNDVLVLPGGRILVAGYFGKLNGQARVGIARLESNGAIDPTFTVTPNQGVQAMLRQLDGKVVLSGQFTSVGGQIRKGLARLNGDGTVDMAFDPGAVFYVSPNDGVHSLAVQADGRILAAGFFTLTNSFDPSNRRQLLRFYPDGTFDSSFPMVTNTAIRAVAVQRDGKILVAGGFTNFLGQPRSHLARLLPDGTLEPTFGPNVSGGFGLEGTIVNDLAVQRDGKIVVAGWFTNLAGHARSNIGRIYPDGMTDATLNAGPLTAPNGAIYTAAVQPDGKILIGGAFTQLFGAARDRIARLHPDGTLDAGFNPGASNIVWNLAVQPDGRILAGGFFTNMGGYLRRHLARLTPDGTVDMGFNPAADNAVRSLILQRDGKILVGGDFTMMAGEIRGGLARLDEEGNLDPSFDPGANDGVRAVAIEANDRIIVGGGFTMLSGQPRQRLARIDANGILDSNFNPGADNWVRCLVVQPDGKILVAGQFTTLAGQPRGRIGRLNSEGVLDTTFVAEGNEQIWSVALETGGKIIVAGDFTMLNGQPCNRVGRLNDDGSLDTTFGSGANGNVRAVVLQPDGKVIVGGHFFSFDGRPRPSIARLASDTAATQSVGLDSSGRQLTWTRGGASPEVDLVTFEQSTDGINYVVIGNGTRTPGGWHVNTTGLPVGQTFYVRARGRALYGVYSSSSSLIESVAQFHRIAQPHITSSSLSNGTWQVTFTNEARHSFSVLATTNLASPQWDVVGSATNIGGTLYRFRDRSATNHAQRFYQLRTP